MLDIKRHKVRQRSYTRGARQERKVVQGKRETTKNRLTFAQDGQARQRGRFKSGLESKAPVNMKALCSRSASCEGSREIPDSAFHSVRSASKACLGKIRYQAMSSDIQARS